MTNEEMQRLAKSMRQAAGVLSEIASFLEQDDFDGAVKHAVEVGAVKPESWDDMFTIGERFVNAVEHWTAP